MLDKLEPPSAFQDPQGCATEGQVLWAPLYPCKHVVFITTARGRGRQRKQSTHHPQELAIAYSQVVGAVGG